MLTAQQFSQNIIAQVRILDPSFSGEVGTPERKIIDTVAQALADNQIDLTGLGSALDINTKVGANLDAFTSVFGMARQQANAATSYVVYSRNTPAPANINIPQGSVVQANNSNTNVPTTVQYATTQAGTIAIGATSSGPVPIQAVVEGSSTNVAANTLTQMVGGTVSGVTAVTNPVAITNGLDAEDDNSYKTRFQNTWARNLAGTSSQYLAIALAAAFTTKANCIGPESVYREYIQVPNADDAGLAFGVYNPNEDTYGVSGQWTSALSDIPYAAQIFTTTPVFISEDSISPTYFFRDGTDFVFNSPPSISGDALRDSPNTQQLSTTVVGGPYSVTGTGTTINVTATGSFPSAGTMVDMGVGAILTYTGTTPTSFTGVTASTNVTVNPNDLLYLTQAIGSSTLYVESVDGFPASNGAIVVGVTQEPYVDLISVRQQVVFYQDINLANNSFTGCTWEPENLPLGTWYVAPQTNLYYQPFSEVPNFTFLNVFNPATDVTSTGLQALNPGDVVLSEYRYLSTASRNDLGRNINNAVDVYVNGANDVQASTVFLPNVGSVNSLFLNDPTKPFYYENFRRNGEPTKRPQIGNYFTGLYQSPLDGLPSDGQIQIAGQTFYEGWHYWLVNEVGPLAGSIRARDGIEWNANLVGDTGSGPPSNVLAPYIPTGTESIFSLSQAGTPVEVDGYLYDANIVTMQASMEQAKQITTDVLVHKAATRYFKFMLTLQYAPQQTPAVVNGAIQQAIQAYLNNQYFGTVIQLSNIIETVGSVTGVQNVRWTNDIPNPTTSLRVIETDINGNPLAGAFVDRFQNGIWNPSDPATGVAEQQTLYIVGNPSGLVNGQADSFSLSWTDATTTNGGSITGLNNTMFTGNIPFYDVTTGLPSDASVIFEYLTAALTYAPFGATGMYTAIAVEGDRRATQNVPDPIQSFTLTYAGNGTPVLPTVTNNVTASEYVHDNDFFLLDNQLPSLPINAAPGDTLPGLVIEVRAQNTWLRNL